MKAVATNGRAFLFALEAGDERGWLVAGDRVEEANVASLTTSGSWDDADPRDPATKRAFERLKSFLVAR